MKNDVGPAISLEQARELVTLLEADKQEEANALFLGLKDASSDDLFKSVGKLTRQLHDSLSDFQLDPRLEKMTSDDLPDAKNRLNYVMERTEDAANRTMDAVEASLPLAESLGQEIDNIRPVWDKLMSRDIELKEFKKMCHQLDNFFGQARGNSENLHMLLTEVLMAQDFQDLTGQVIRRVIELVQEVEESLIELLTVFGDQEKARAERKGSPAKAAKEQPTGAEGPIIDPDSRTDVVDGQDDVDDLLSSLGF